MVTLYVKNMVCPRCIRVVREELEALGFTVKNVELGEVTIEQQPTSTQKERIRNVLVQNGFELIEDKNARVIEKIKHAVLQLVQNDYDVNPIRVKDSVYLAGQVGIDYHTLSSLFSAVENITLEQYIILQRIERVKEFLKYGEHTLTEISYKLGYSSVAHLSNQFRKVTGMSPTIFKQMRKSSRTPIDQISRRTR